MMKWLIYTLYLLLGQEMTNLDLPRGNEGIVVKKWITDKIALINLSNSYRFYLLLTIAFLFASCEEIIYLDLPSGEKRLVVEGLITDEPGPYEIRISRTRQYSYTFNDTTQYEKGADVSITDDLGNSEKLKEVHPGIYKTDSLGVRGKIGLSYFVTIKTLDGRTFQSSPELLQRVPLLEDFHYELEYNHVEEYGPGNDVYLNFLVNDPPDEENFYLQKIWTVGRDRAPDPPYIYSVFNDKFVNGGQLHERNQIARIWGGYYFHCTFKQYSLSKAAFEFWKNVVQQTTEVGGPYDTPPSPIIGNISNIDDPKDYALGYFGASAVSSVSVVIKN